MQTIRISDGTLGQYDLDQVANGQVSVALNLSLDAQSATLQLQSRQGDGLSLGSLDPQAVLGSTTVDYSIVELSSWLSQASLSYLQSHNVALNGSAVDVRLASEHDGTATLNMLFSLIGGDLDLSFNGVRRSNRYLSYYGIDTSGNLSTLTYDPRKSAGARAYDLDGNGLPDFLNLKVIDGGYGDKDGLVNGVIDDPSAAASEDLRPILATIDARTMAVGDPSRADAPVSLRLRGTLQGRTVSADQIGYVVFDAIESTDLTFADFRSRSRGFISTLERGDVVLPDGLSFDQEVLLLNGQRIQFCIRSGVVTAQSGDRLC